MTDQKRTRKGPPTQEERDELEAQARAASEKLDERKREGVPPVETPEEPARPPEETPRSEESPVETPEAPVGPPVREETQVISREEFAESLAEKAPTRGVRLGSKLKPSARSLDSGTVTNQALVQVLGGGPGGPAPVPLSADEAALITSQHNL